MTNFEFGTDHPPLPSTTKDPPMPDATTEQIITAFKGFDSNLKCREFQYVIGQEYEHAGSVRACNAGFHACEFALDVFAYYPPNESRFCSVEMTGELSRDGSDSKMASAKLKVVAEIGIPDIVTAAVAWIMRHVDRSIKQTVVAGDSSAATNTGDSSAATNTGHSSAATNTGHGSAATNTGHRSAATNTGYRSAATNTGHRSAATNTGHGSAATNTGHSSAATNTGHGSAATNTGHRSVATNTGYSSAATNTGYSSAATNTGYSSAATVEGKESVAIATGYDGRAKAASGSAIVVCYRDFEFRLVHIFASKVGENGIEPDVFYRLDEHGIPQPVNEVSP